LFLDYKKYIIALFIVLSAISVFFALKIKFDFSFEQFFPKGDDDLAYFEEFTKDFESDDNFLLIAIERPEGIFDSTFLSECHELSLEMRSLPHVIKTQSLTQLRYPVRTPFGISMLPLIHLNNPEKYEEDKRLIMSDQRFVNNLIDEDATVYNIALKTENLIGLKESDELMIALNKMLTDKKVKNHHIVGRANFQHELVKMQKYEIIKSSFISSFLILILLIVLLRKKVAVCVALISIGVGMLLFFGLLGVMGRPLDIMAAFYPVLMIIVGTSDVIHIMSKYIDELKAGVQKRLAMENTIKEIGLATLLTSLTTAVGFFTLVTSRVGPIKYFGINSALGVMVAFLTVIFFSTSLLSLFEKEQLISESKSENGWNAFINKISSFTIKNSQAIFYSSIVFLLICVIGVSKITTNYQIADNLPMNSKITEDFIFFEDKLAGFRPMEFAITTKKGAKADSYEVLKEVNKIENYLLNTGVVKSMVSQATLYKSINRMNNANKNEAYQFPPTEQEFNSSKKLISRLASGENTLLINEDNTKTRISSRIADIGADSIKSISNNIENFIASNVDTSLIVVKITGTGVIVDKNAAYIRNSLMQGLGLALLVIGLLMMFLFKNFRMLFIALIANLIPVLFAAAILGFLKIPLEAGISITFAIVFGIAVDDTIHFLSKFKLALNKGYTVDKAIERSYAEAGKAITFTTIILFFGFLVMIFSSHPPSIIIGSLISITLISAWAFDLFLLPILLRKFYK
jgi:hypothetical protein